LRLNEEKVGTFSLEFVSWMFLKSIEEGGLPNPSKSTMRRGQEVVSFLTSKWSLDESQWLTNGEVGNRTTLRIYCYYRVPWALSVGRCFTPR